MKTHDALAVANWFLATAEAERKTLDPMKLQKLIYFADGWSLALTNVPLINEQVQAWKWGPVIPSVYHEFKVYGRRPITRMAEISDTVWGDRDLEIKDDPDAEALLTRVWQVYGHLSGVQLSNMTHAPDGAWHQAYREANGRRNVAIEDALIRAEFLRKVKGAGAAADHR